MADGTQLLEVGRGRGKKKFMTVAFNGVDKTCDTDTETQLELWKILQIDIVATMKEIGMDFLNSVYLSTATIKGFMDKDTKSKQRFDLIARFLGLKKYDTATAKANTKKKDLLAHIEGQLEDVANKELWLKERDVKTLERYIQSCSDAIKVNEGAIKDLQDVLKIETEKAEVAQRVPALEQQIETKKSTINTQIDMLQRTHVSNTEEVAKRQQKLTAYDELATKVEALAKDAANASESKTTLKNEVATIRSEVNSIQLTTGEQKAKQASLQKQISDTLQCPKCKTALMLKDNVLAPIDKDALTKDLAQIDSTLSTVASAVASKESRIKELEATIGTADKAINTYNENIALINAAEKPVAINAQITAYNEKNVQIAKQADDFQAQGQTELDGLRVELEKATAELEKVGPATHDVAKLQEDMNNKTLDITSNNQAIGRHQQSIKDIGQAEADLKVLQAKISQKKAEADIYGFWEIGFKAIKVQIIKDFLPALQDSTNDYLSKLKVGMRVEFDTEKKKAQSTKKEKELGLDTKQEFDITAYDSKGVRPFGLFSQGERGRISTCVGLALNSLTKEKGVMSYDFLLIDEVADALDPTGVMEFVRLLDEMPGQKLVVSHDDVLKNYFDSTLTAEITDGVSTIRGGYGVLQEEE